VSEAEDDGVTCQWVDWCARAPAHEVEMSNSAGSERMLVCRLHLKAAQIYGFRAVGDPWRSR
jgi:hypothetical protein